MLRIVAHTLEGTIGAMYELIVRYSGDARDFGWSTLQEVFRGVQGTRYVSDDDALSSMGVQADEFLKRPRLTYLFGGDCDDKTILAGAALHYLGIPLRIATSSHRSDQVMDHVYLEVFVGGVWRPFDATYPGTRIFEETSYTDKLIWSASAIHT